MVSEKSPSGGCASSLFSADVKSGSRTFLHELMASDRIRRPPLDRTEPRRGWSTLFGTTPPLSDAAASAGGASDAIARSVDLGYRVIDDYITRGQQAAERVRQGTYGSEALTGDLQDLSVRLIRYASDFTATWLELIERTRVPPPPSVAPTSTAEATATPLGEPLSVRLELITSQPAEMALDFRPAPATRQVIVHALRPAVTDQPRIESVEFVAVTTTSGIIRIRVPDGHPHGNYSGLIIDAETNRPVGAVSVVLREH
jgi:hypothetical protein